MTLMLASVTGPEEAEIAIAGGADIIDLKDPSRGAFGARSGGAHPRDRRGRRRARARPAPSPAICRCDPERVLHAAEAIAATGVDFVKVGLFPGDGRARGRRRARSASRSAPS